MAMSKCKECEKAVSTLAKTCPHCGVPKPAQSTKKKSSLESLEVNKKNKSMAICCSNINCSVWADPVDVPKKNNLKNYECPRCYSKMIKYDEKIVEQEAKKAKPWEINQRIEKERAKTSYEQTTPPKPGDENYDKFLEGDVDLATAFWGYMFVGAIAVGFVCGFLTGMLGPWLSIPLVLYTGWAAAGVWASAENYKIKKTEKNQSVVWGVLAQIFSVINVVSALGFVLQAFTG